MKKGKRIISILLAVVLVVSGLSFSVPYAIAAGNEETIYNYLKNNMKLNTAAACGVIANIYYESGFRPNALGDNGTSYGICQWHNSRWDRLKTYCSNNGYDSTTLTGQLNYLNYELKNYYPSVYKYLTSVSNTSQGAYDAAYYWCYYFEIPANRSSVSVTRGNKARDTYWPKYYNEPIYASDSKYSSFKGCKAYICKTAKTACYENDLSTSAGYIYIDDYCTISDFYTNGYCKVECPWSDGTTKTVYTQISNFIISTSTSIGSFTSQSYINLYTTASRSTQIFRIYPGDVCYTIGSSGTSTQVLMPHNSGYYVLGWVQTSELPSANSSYSKDNRYPTPFKCRILSNSKVSAALTVGGERQSDTNVYVDDDCVITEVYTNGWCKFTCPWSDGSTKTLYLPLSEFINANVEPYTFKATQYTDTYFKSDKATKIGWIDVGDSVTVVSVNGSVSQVIYPADVGMRCAWANSSALTSTYTVSYNANGGTGAPASQSKTPGTALTLSSTKPTRTGYTFVGWSTSASATLATYTAGSIYTNDSSVTLYAVWRQITYKVNYDLCGGTGDISEQTKTYGVDLTLSSTVPTKIGYAFDSWNTAIDGSGIKYKSGSKYSSNAELKLYAQWIPNTYTITYNGNGGSNVPEAQTKSHDVDIIISETIPIREGHRFVGWTTSRTSETVSYLGGDDFTLNEDVTLYALWIKEEDAILYGDVNGDNEVNGKDLVRLRKYLISLDENTGISSVEVSPGADVNGDGVINGKDLVRLRKNLLNSD